MSLTEKTTTNREGTIAGYPVWAGTIQKRVGGAARGENGGYVIAAVRLVHMHECRGWRSGRRRGPCTCGADAAWQAFAERQGDSDPFASIRAEEGTR